MCSAYVWPWLVQSQGKKLTLFPHVAHGVFITFCDSSSLRFHLPLQNNLIPSSEIRGRLDCFRVWKHPSSYSTCVYGFFKNNSGWVKPFGTHIITPCQLWWDSRFEPSMPCNEHNTNAIFSIKHGIHKMSIHDYI